MAATLGFYGGVGSVTGANFMLDTGQAAFLIDCGLIQGDQFAQAQNFEPFPYDPAAVDVLIVTHAHADHIGRIPRLVREGFRGVIYSTQPTLELARIMLDDAVGILALEAEQADRMPLYTPADVDQTLGLWKVMAYDQPYLLPDNVTATFTNAGHILGSAMVTLTRAGRTIVFTGDIGNVPQPLMAPPEVPHHFDYLIMESVYGDRVHEEVAERTNMLERCIQSTIAKNGTLIIPAFSLERTQGMLFEINNLVESGAIPKIKTYLDSPLAIRVTDVYRHASEYLKPEVQAQIARGDDIFAFEGLSFTETVRESAAIAEYGGPKIIIAGSGMSHGGRIREHEKRFLGDTNTTLLLVGYQGVGSIGRLLQDGAKQVTIDGVVVTVRARIETIRGYSGHADRNQLMELVYRGTQEYRPTEIFVTMGEERASLFLTQRLRDYCNAPARVPYEGEEVQIDF